MKYDIRLVAVANMSTLMTVEAESEQQAELLAIQAAKNGDASWSYDGLASDNSIEVGE